MNILKQSTAATIKFGPFIDDTDGKTSASALTISQADIRLSKNGGNIAQTNNATGATHDELGYYDIPLDTTDTNTLGRLRVAVHESGALPVWQDFIILPANVYDSLIGGSTSLNVNSTSASTVWTYNERYLTSGSGILDVIAEGTYTVEEILQIIVSILAGKLSGAGTNTLTFRDLSDTLNRVVATVDGTGNRTDININV